MKSAIKNGLIATLILSVLYFVVYYLIDPKLNYNFLYAILSSYTIYLIFMVRSAIEERTKMGGSLGFGEAFIPAMVCFAVVSLCYLIVTFAHIKLDPNVLDLSEEATIESMEKFSDFLGTPKEEVLEQLDEQGENHKNMHNVSMYLVMWVGSLLFPGLLLGVIAAAIAKKKAPLA